MYRNCFRCKTSWYKNQEVEGAYSYWVTYAPYSEVILYITPVRVERSREQMADEVYGYANLTDTQKEFFDIMYDDELTEEQFRPVANLYKTCKFEYPFLPYQYTQYAGHNDSLLLCGEDNQIYINGMYETPDATKVYAEDETRTVVFYTRYSGMGEHYFNMRLERMPDGSMRILEIVRRYMD